ncbi:hypothetical protein B0A50_05848 [Salinomyces thailandicus]|uniref:Uncharacterized protein n=1 Tax=Salinomyces thailandicus TaxID=706561 RepID=A0A4U0TTX3_9PEZI|nr:hypothetical protein B0A50_05848 [Salinomyces thailandica]
MFSIRNIVLALAAVASVNAQSSMAAPRVTVPAGNGTGVAASGSGSMMGGGAAATSIYTGGAAAATFVPAAGVAAGLAMYGLL